MDTYLVISQTRKYLRAKEVDEMYDIELSCKGDPRPIYHSRELFKLDINNGLTVNFLLRSGETHEMLGFSILSDYRRWGWYLFHMAIKKKYRGMGYEDKLVDERIEYACVTIDEPERLSLHVAVGNTPTQEYYKNRGFEVEKTVRHHFWTGEDAIKMSKIIQPIKEEDL